MAKKRRPLKVSEPKIARSYRLNPARISAARRILGVDTDTAAIETALDMVVFRRELIDATRALRGVRIASPDD